MYRKLTGSWLRIRIFLFLSKIHRESLSFMSTSVFSMYSKIVLAYFPDTFIFFMGDFHARTLSEMVKKPSHATLPLKGQCHEIFCFWFFPWISFPQAPDYTIRAVSIFFWKFVEIFAAQGLPPVSWTLMANGKNLQSEKFLWFIFTPSGSRLAYRNFFFSS